MGRSPRIFVSGYPHHVVQRGHNLDAVFIAPDDYAYYLDNLREWKRAYDIGLLAYCLMTNHVHLVVVPRDSGAAISALMRRLSARQGRYVNRQEGRRGTLWCGRFKSSLIDTDEYLRACLRYVELNPVRAGMVSEPAGYRWSSHAERIGLAPRDLLDDDLGVGPLGARESVESQSYCDYVAGAVSPAEYEFIRSAVQRNQLTGGGRFIDDIARRTGVRIDRRAPGRPARRQQESR